MAKSNAIRAGRAFVELFADDTKLVRGLRAAEKKLKAFGTAISRMGRQMVGLGAAVLTPLVAVSKAFAAMGDAMGKMSKRTGFSTEALSELSFAAQQSGTTIETLEGGVRKMQRTISDAGQGSKSAADALGMLGLSYGHRQWDGTFCISDSHKGQIQVTMNNEIGFLEKETLFGKLDTSDGHFKIKVPIGGLTLEPCAVTLSDFLTGRKYGVRFTCDPQKLGYGNPVLDSCGVAFFDGTTQSFVWAGIDDAGSFKDGGQYGSQLWGMEFGGRGGPQSQYDPKMLYTTKSVLSGGDTPVWTHYTETWTPSGISLNHNVEFETGTKIVVGWQSAGGDPPVPDYSKPIEYVLTGIHTPWFNTAGFAWRRVSWRQGWQQYAYSGFQCSNGRLYGGWMDSWQVEIPEHQWSSTQITGFGYRPDTSPLSNRMELYVAWQVHPSDIHPDCDVWDVLAQCKDYFVVYATDYATWSLRYYAIIRKSDGAILHVHNWADYPHLSDPTSAGVLSGTAWLFCRDVVNDKAAAFNMQSDHLQQYFYWRDVYRWPSPPWPPARGFQVPKSDGQLGWGFHTAYPYLTYETVFRGNVCLLGPVEDFYLAIGQCGPTEDLSGSCPEGYHKARARFTVKSLPSNDPVHGAAVTVKITAGPAGENPVYENELTATTNSSGQVWFEPPCVERNTVRDFVFTFTVLSIVKEGMLYAANNNVCSQTEHVFEGLPGWWCDTQEFPLAPDPAQFQLDFPFKGQVGGKWYHIMVAEPATHATDCVEYRFVCQDDPGLGSGWRNFSNTQGQTFPDGRSQTGRPHEYWAQVPDGGTPYNGYQWSVQYRACDCEGYEGGTPSPWTGIQNG